MTHSSPDLASPLSAISDLDPILASLTAEFSGRAAEHDRQASFAFENIARLRELGLLGLTVPKIFGGGVPSAFGGGEVTLSLAARIIRAIGQGDPSTALVLVMQYVHHIHLARDDRWPASLRERVQRDAVENGALINSLRVEPELGTPARGGLPNTIARRTPEGWRLSGHKLYSTGIPALTWLSVWGRTDDDNPSVGPFLVHRDTPGVKIIESWDHLGMRASGSHEVIFEDVLIPLDHAVDLRPPAAWARGFDPDQMAWMTVLVASLYDGVAQGARDWFAEFANERVPANLGAPLASLSRFQEAAGVIDALLFSNAIILQKIAEATDRGDYPSVRDCNFTKYIVTKNAIEAVEHALELSGNPGLTRSNPLERHYRDVLCSRIHTPQNDVILTSAGRDAFASRALREVA
ncbi:acyl-CoA dehydrogenase family protein [Beijerinckia indica]|uniref:Acyl-CoA dehydrogenase type 2 domain n=1 Tax=Beijerinckia indica subsp. indica (strain ATCC 9039 / DSM 1715 / NCIMB 8712) TaxID=395963 RepID=B2IEY4_BEII9|nr:acyl-CoA dehydrogenase family protein [Beijerinckia indica]ACB94175.1 Acyl-CoA dehydrogenase type 2 domain [Beijerinckia indica subsp. indica ATCC 9039]